MKLRLALSRLCFLLGLGISLGSPLALADDGKGQHGDSNSQTSSNETGQNEEQSERAGIGSGQGDEVTQSEDAATAHELSESPEKEQEEVAQAVASGRAAPLTLLLKKLKSSYPGQILDVTLVRLSAPMKFRVKYIDQTGLVKTVTLNALTLETE